MRSNFKKSTLALAVAALVGSPAAFAADPVDPNITYDNELKASLEQNSKGDIETEVKAKAKLDPKSAASAIIDDKQIITGNAEVSILEANVANVADSLNGNTGSAQSNVAAGFNNNQDNAAAISANLSGEYGFADADVFVFQDIQSNLAVDIAQVNSATVTNSVNNNLGSVQSNVVAGVYNNQKNNLAIAVANDGVLATASVGSLQQISGNLTVSVLAANIADVTGSITGNVGSVQSNVAAGAGNNQSNSLAISAGL